MSSAARFKSERMEVCMFTRRVKPMGLRDVRSIILDEAFPNQPLFQWIEKRCAAERENPLAGCRASIQWGASDAF